MSVHFYGNTFNTGVRFPPSPPKKFMRAKKLFPFLILLVYQALFLPLIYFSISRGNPLTVNIETVPIAYIGILLSYLLFLAFSYWLVLYLFSQQLISVKPKTLIITLIPLFVLLLAVPPLLSNDLYAYATYSRNYCHFNADPYIVDRSFFGQNTWHYLIGDDWLYMGPNLYGPVIVLLTKYFGCFSNLFTSVVALKILMFVFFLVSGYLITLNKFLSKNPLLPYLYFLNPALLVHLVMDGHNNIIAITFLLLYLLLPLSIWTTSLLNLAFFSRLSYLLFSPMLLVKTNLKRLFIVGIIFVSTFGVLTIPFRFNVKAIFAVLFALPNACYGNCPFPQEFIAYIGLPNAVLTILFIVFYGFLFKFLYLGKISEGVFCLWSYLIFLLLLIKWLTPWYLLLPLILAITLSTNKRYLVLVHMLTVYIFLRSFGIV